MQSTRRLWLIAVGLSLCPAVTNGFARFAYGLVLPSMRDDLMWTYTQAGWINTANAAGYLIGALAAWIAIPRLGVRRLFIAGMAVTAVALLLSALTRDFWMLVRWRILAGVGGAPAFIAGGALASALFKGDNSRNALAIAVYFGGGGFGMLLSGLGLPLMLDRMGAAAWPQAWLLLGAASCLAFLPSWWAVRALRLPAVAELDRITTALPMRKMVPELAGYFLFAVGYIVYVTFIVAWMQTQDATAQLVALTWSILGVAVMASPFLWRRMLTISKGGGALALSCALTGTGTLLPLFLGGAVGLVLSAALFGVSFFIAPAAITSFSRKNLLETQWGTSVALFTTLFAIGQMVGPVAAGVIADRTDSISLSLAGAGVTLLIAAIVATAQAPLSGHVLHARKVTLLPSNRP
ncbi:MAG: YbfB/YjiJ family MFS transporter [Pseudolabrys sp.]